MTEDKIKVALTQGRVKVEVREKGFSGGRELSVSTNGWQWTTTNIDGGALDLIEQAIKEYRIKERKRNYTES